MLYRYSAQDIFLSKATTVHCPRVSRHTVWEPLPLTLSTDNSGTATSNAPSGDGMEDLWNSQYKVIHQSLQQHSTSTGCSCINLLLNMEEGPLLPSVDWAKRYLWKWLTSMLQQGTTVPILATTSNKRHKCHPRNTVLQKWFQFLIRFNKPS